MKKQIILVNGIPASGKSQVAKAISTALSLPIFTLDAIKEPFFEHLGVGDREYNRQLGRASYQAIFNVLADFPKGTTSVIDAWFGFQPLEVLERHIKNAGIDNVVEVWCQARPDVVAGRYASRVGDRPVGHPGMEYVPELINLAKRAMPLGCFKRLNLDTNTPVDMALVLAWITTETS